MTPPRFPLIDIAGSSRERGRQYGAKATRQVHRSLEIYRQAFARSGLTWDKVRVIASETGQRLASVCPALHDEVLGIAEGAGVAPEEIVALNARTEIFYRCNIPGGAGDGCTGAIVMPEATADSHLLHATNWDWMAESSETTLVLRITPESGPRVLTMTEAGILARCGFNEHGIAMSGNFLLCQHDGANAGIPIPFVRRGILECTNFDAAMRFVMEAPRSFSTNIMISTIGAEAINLETTPQDVFWLQPCHGILVHANHFMSPAALARVEDRGLRVTPSSLYRQRRVEAYLQARRGKVTLAHLKEALADRFGAPDAVCASPSEGTGGDSSCTVATVLVDVTAQRMWIAPRPFESPVFSSYDFTMPEQPCAT